MVTFIVNRLPLDMKLDMGSPVSLHCKHAYQDHLSTRSRQTEDVTAKFIPGPIPLQGRFTAHVRLGEITSRETLLVVSSKGPNLCGKD